MRYRPNRFTVVVGVGALLGLLFAGVSTYDFVMHLDRQVHDIHCSFVPGLSGTQAGESGCQMTLVSPYSSVLRTSIWGGIPISLAAMAVFAFLLAFAVDLVLTRRERDVRATGFLALATGLPALTSVVMAYLALVRLDAVCKLCIGIYFSSALCLAGALLLFFRARRSDGPEEVSARAARPARPAKPFERDHAAEPAWVGATGEPEQPEPEPEPEPEPRPATTRRPPVTWGYLAAAFGVGVLFVAVPMTTYVIAAPDHERFIGTCGVLTVPDDPSDVMVPLDRHPGAPTAVEVLDPLCPACRGFEDRLDASGLEGEMDRKAVLFPLDHSCNWMVDTTLHPGACTVSLAVLCAGDRAPAVIDWAFEHHAEVREATAADPSAAERMVTTAFPDLGKCLGSAAAKARLNRALRWAVSNRLPVTTPQLYVSGVRLCEEDVDIGLDFALSHMLSLARAGKLTAEVAAPTPAPATEPAHHAASRDQEPAAEPAHHAASHDQEPAAQPPPKESPPPTEPTTTEPTTTEPTTTEPTTTEPTTTEPPPPQEPSPAAQPAAPAPPPPDEEPPPDQGDGDQDQAPAPAPAPKPAADQPAENPPTDDSPTEEQP